MFDPNSADSMLVLPRSYQTLLNLRAFDKSAVDPVIRGQLGLAATEECRILIYVRAQRNLDSIIALNHVAHFQAASMIARSLFELSIEIRLIEVVHDATARMLAFQGIEKLRAARAAIARSEEPNGATASETVKTYVKSRRSAIEARAATIWQAPLGNIRHWSLLNLKQRVDLLNDEVTKHIYAYTYKAMSWQVHPGLQGSFGLPPSAFPTITKSALNLAAFSYVEVLKRVMGAFGLKKFDPLIEAKLDLARMLPLTDDDEEEVELRRFLNL